MRQAIKGEHRQILVAHSELQAANLLDALTVEELATLGHLIDKLVARAEEIATASEEFLVRLR